MQRLPGNIIFKWSVLLAVSFLAFFWRLGDVSFLENEGMYATIVQGMVSSGDWVTPRFNEVRYFEKPPLWFWLTSGVVWVMGASEFSIRLLGAVAAFGLVILTYLFGRKLDNDRAGFFAALVLASSFVLPMSARRTSTDLLFCLFVTLSIYGFAATIRSGSRTLWNPILFSLGAALSVLAKGLMGLIFPLLIPAVYILVVREFEVIHKLKPLLGVAIFLLITVPWHLAVAVQNEGFLSYYLIDHHFLRFLGERNYPHYDIPASTAALVLLIIPWFFPWVLFLPGAIMNLWKKVSPGNSREDKIWLLLAIWIFVVIGFFAASSFKHGYYTLPAFPALALLVGRFCAQWGNKLHAFPASVSAAEASRNGNSTVGVHLCLLTASVGAILYLGVLVLFRAEFSTDNVMAGLAHLNVSFRVLMEQGVVFPEQFGPNVFTLLIFGGLLALIGFGTAYLLSWRRQYSLAFGSITVMALAVSLLIVPFYGLLEPYYSAKSVALVIKNRVGPQDLLVNEGPLEVVGGLGYYTNRRLRIVKGEHGSLGFGATYDDAKDVFLGEKEFVGFWNSPQKVFVVTGYSINESVLSSVSPAKIHEIGRFGLRRLYSNHVIQGEQIENRATGTS